MENERWKMENVRWEMEDGRKSPAFTWKMGLKSRAFDMRWQTCRKYGGQADDFPLVLSNESIYVAIEKIHLAAVNIYKN
ncbi:MAG: hypothetical protein V1720_15065 [bacterium]